MAIKAHTYKARLSSEEKQRMKEYINTQAKEIARETVNLSTQNIFLQTIYLFYSKYGFRAKRLKRLCDQLQKQKIELDKLYDEQSMVAVMIERMKSCGADFTPTFEELLLNEEERFRKKKEQEQAIRIRKAQLTPEQKKLVEEWEK